jgi:hypothetical protein
MKQACRIVRWTGTVALAIALAAAAAAAQSLGEVARKEQARRKNVPGSGKVYTNDNIRGGSAGAPMTPAAVPAQAPASPSAGQGKGDEKAPDAADPKKDEAHWRARVSAARSGLERARAFQDALQSQINGLSTDFLARDDPAQRASIGEKRQKALAELERVKKDIAGFEKELRDIEEEARRAGVPPGWLR